MNKYKYKYKYEIRRKEERKVDKGNVSKINEVDAKGGLNEWEDGWVHV
jgi:hypothetical protein